MTDDATPDVEFRRVTKRFDEVVAVDAVDLAVRKGEFLALLGPSGCGKTTSLRMVAGFEDPSEGEILIDGEPAVGVPAHKRDVNTVFQHYALFPHMSVQENVAYGLKQRKVGGPERQRRASGALRLVRMEGMEHRRPSELSGGQQQRVALARALIMGPKVLLLDEPLGALDMKLRKEMQIELKRIQEEVGITFIIVTHDQEEAMALADRVAVMDRGRIEQLDAPRIVYDQPATPFVASFIGDMNHLEGTLGDESGPVVDCGGGLRLRIGRVIGEAQRGARVRVGLRPEQITARVGDEPELAEVLTAMVVGHQLQLLCRLRNDAEVLVRQARGGEPALELLEPGHHVSLTWGADAPMLLGPADARTAAATGPQLHTVTT